MAASALLNEAGSRGNFTGANHSGASSKKKGGPIELWKPERSAEAWGGAAAGASSSGSGPAAYGTSSSGSSSSSSSSAPSHARDFTHLMHSSGGPPPAAAAAASSDGPPPGPPPGLPPEKANFGLSGILAEDKKTGNTFNGVQLKWSEPPEARMPTRRWRFYVFKDGEQLDKPLHLHRQTAYLVGREARVADIRVDHPSCSKQHAVIQFRLVESRRDAAQAHLAAQHRVKPYLMDLQATNGTSLNGDKIEDSRYYELKHQDLIKFGHSSREYVLLDAGPL